MLLPVTSLAETVCSPHVGHRIIAYRAPLQTQDKEYLGHTNKATTPNMNNRIHGTYHSYHS